VASISAREELSDHINDYMKKVHLGKSKENLKDIISLSRFNTLFFAQQKLQNQCFNLVTKYPTLNYLIAARILLLTNNVSDLKDYKVNATFNEFYSSLMDDYHVKESNLKHRLEQFINSI